jgi:hypothetical protein
MGTELQKALMSLPFEQWQVKQLIVLDWHDGPREGVCEMLQPACSFYFKIIAEEMHKGGHTGALFSINELPIKTTAQIIATLADLNQPINQVWVPIWIFPNEAAQLDAEKSLEELLSLRSKSNIIIRSKDMIVFMGCWNIVDKDF